MNRAPAPLPDLVPRAAPILAALIATCSVLLCVLLSAPVRAQGAAEFSGQMGSFATDVLQDLVLDGKSAEESGQARLKSFVEGKLLGDLKKSVTGGDDLSEGMGLILNRIFDGVNSFQRRRGGRPGMCDLAAMNQAFSIAFDAKNLRLLRGAGNVWFDLVTSGIRGAPGLAEKLVQETARLGYEKLRAGLEKQIKDWWAAQQPETFTYSKSSGPCTVTMTVIWNKAKSRYLFLIKGSCDCKLVPISPPYVGGNITMRGFELIGGGSINVSLDTSGERPRVRINAGIPRYELRSQCDCRVPESRLPPPPPPQEDPITLPEQGRMRQATGARCPACAPILERANAIADEYNALAARMDALAPTITQEKFKTPERDNNLAKWNEWARQLDALEKSHDKTFAEFAACEQSECANTGPVRLDEHSTQREGWTDCKPCISLMQALNADIAKYNPLVEEMNALASYATRTKLHRGTREGNDLFAKWTRLDAQRAPLASAIERARAELSACQARECSTARWEPWQPWRPVTGTCSKCQALQIAANDAIAEQNAIIAKLNAGLEREKAYVQKHGDAWGAGLDGLADLRDEYGLRDLLRQQRESLEKVTSALAALRACERRWCVAVEVVDVKNVTGNNPLEPRDPLAPEAREADAGPAADTGTGVDTAVGDDVPAPGTPAADTPATANGGAEPTLQVLFIGGRAVPLTQFVVEDHVAPPPACPDHYHAANFSNVTACDGTLVPDPFACPGYGFTNAVPVQSIPLSSCANP